MYNISGVSALTYGGTANYSIPSVYSNTGVQLYSASAPTSGGAGANPIFDQDLGMTRLVSWTAGIRYKSGSVGSYSGLVMRISQTSCGAGGGQGCYWYNWINIDLMVSTGATKDQYYISIDKYIQNDGGLVHVATIPQFTLDNNTTCPGQTPDCLLVVQPRLYYKEEGSVQGMYLPYIDYTWYYDSDRKTQYFRAYFGDLSENGPNPTTWESVKSWLGLGVTGYGLFTGWNLGMSLPDSQPYQGPYNNYWASLSLCSSCWNTNGLTSGLAWNRDQAPNNDDTLLRDYFVGNTGSIIETLFPSWVNASGLKASVINSDGTISSGSGSSGGGAIGGGADFSACTSFLDVGCYIQATYNGFSSWFGGLWSGLWNYFIPNISFTGQSSTCMDGTNSFTASGGLSYTQKLVNLFVVAVPVAPPDGSTVCTLSGQKTIDYTPTAPGFIDLILIFICVLPIFFGGRSLAGTNKQ